MTRSPFLAAMLLVTLAFAPVAFAEGGALILDETCYCRAYYHFDVQKIDPAALKADGEKTLGPALMGRLQRLTEKRLEAEGVEAKKVDWRDRVTVDVQYNSFARKNRIFVKLGSITEAPVDAWLRPEFDDSAWLHQRKPDGVGSPALYSVGNIDRNGWLRGVYLRFRFELPDPAKAAPVTFSADYIGGLCAFVNGVEIARGGLPAGALAPEQMAEPYPEESYLAYFADLPADERARMKGKEPPANQPVRGADELTPLGSRLYKARNRTVDTLTIPPALLRKGTNVLAIELRAAPLHPYVMKEWFGYRAIEDRQWEHARLSRLELRTAAKDPDRSGLARPKGVQIWTEDAIRRVYGPEFLEPAAAAPVVRLAGGRNGTYSAQVIVGTDKDLAGVKVTASELKGPAGATIPAASVSIMGMNPQAMVDISTLGEGRIVGDRMGEIGGGNSRYGDWTGTKARVLVTFAPETIFDKNAATAALAKILYYDWISPTANDRIPANSCRPWWLSVKVPADAAPGKYTGAVRVEGPGFAAASMPVELEVLDWRLAEPRDFRTLVAIEQSPWAVAKQYKVPMWSDRHWQLVEASLRQLSRAGNGVWFVPVLAGTEFGNKDESMIRWTRKKDGSYAFDYALLDRWLDLIAKTCGPPRITAFVVMNGFQGPIEVKVRDEATGRDERLNLAPNAPGREKIWAPFARSLYAHMAARGLEQSMYWGYGWDGDGDPGLKPILREAVPEVFWICGSHDANIAVPITKPDPDLAAFYKTVFHSAYWDGLDTTAKDNFYRVVENIQSFLIGGESQKGWKPRAQTILCTPRTDSGAVVVNGTSPPWTFRIFPERALFTGYQGTGRMGGDYWADSYHDGCRHSGGGPGFSIMKCLWPGRDGAESSARLEAMIEGLEELEARIFVEQTLDRGVLPAELAKRAAEFLARHYTGTFAVGVGWQARSKGMYQLAGEVARAVGFDIDREEFGLNLKPGARAKITVKLRNWTAAPRRWKAESAEKWLIPSKPAGATKDFEDLDVSIDAKQLAPDKPAGGTLAITDLDSGRTWTVKVAVRTGTADAP